MPERPQKTTEVHDRIIFAKIEKTLSQYLTKSKTLSGREPTKSTMSSLMSIQRVYHKMQTTGYTTHEARLHFAVKHLRANRIIRTPHYLPNMVEPFLWNGHIWVTVSLIMRLLVEVVGKILKCTGLSCLLRFSQILQN